MIASLEIEDLQDIVTRACVRHEDVAAAVRLAAGRATGDLAELRAEVDRALRTRRFLDYRESSGWAMQARPVVAELRATAGRSPSTALVALIERAVGHVVKVIGHADDSDGTIGDLARELLDLHAAVCDAGVADPLKLAQWMISFRFDDQDWFEVDPVRYHAALGEIGVAWYRREVARRRDGGDRSFASDFALQRLAILDGDVAAIVTLVGGELRSPHHFIRVTEAMNELGRDDDVLAWASRGIAETSGWQVSQLYDLACAVHTRKGRTADVLALRRDHHRRLPSLSTYNALRDVAAAEHAWADERESARSVLAAHDRGGLIDALLADGEPDEAWKATIAAPREWDPGAQRWLRLAQAREPTHPGDALGVYLRLIDRELETTGRAAYARAVAILKLARRAATAAGREAAFGEHLDELRERNRRRPTLIAMLDKAGLGAANGGPPRMRR